MDIIRVKNVRSIIDSGDMKLSSINILLGRNSSGKSSLLRLFPMLKESARNELRGPILWFDENYDFGGFANTYSRHAQEGDELMSLEFTWTPSASKLKTRLYFSSRTLYDSIIDDAKSVQVKLGIGKIGDEVILKKTEILVDNLTVVIEQPTNNGHLMLQVNGREVTTFDTEWDYSSASLMPKLHVLGEETVYDTLVSGIKGIYGEKAFDRHSYFRMPHMKFLKEEEVWKYVEEEILDIKKKRGRIVRKNKEEEEKVIDSVYFMYVNALVHYIDEDISEYFKHTYYITPLRYNFQRYMRNRDLAVEYIESTGKNVMEYILSLKKAERESYVKYIKDTLNIAVEVEGKDNKSIYIRTEDGERDNIVDVGYGFSQVLPIATTLWDRAYKKKSEEYENTIVIEQPEVHLHPAMQKKLALLFVEALKIAKSRKKILKLIVETHSQSLVDRLGKYIANSTPPAVEELLDYYKTGEEENVQIGNDEVSVYLFEKKAGITTITKTNYDKSGRIERWPLGFLE